MQATYNGVDKKFQYLFQNANHVEFTQSLATGTLIGELSIDGTPVNLYAPAGGGGGGVSDVRVDNVSVVDSNHIAQLDSSDFGTTVVANPVETATDDLTKVQIGDTVYDIPGGGGGGSVYLNTIYDDTERQVGYYYGRPLYQRTWDLGANFSFSNNSWTTVAAITGLSDIILVNSLGSQDPSDTAVAKFDTWFDSSNNTIKVRSLRTDNEYVRYITLQYAKNTDSVDTNPQIGNVIYLPTIYSEEERQVGVWTDGKPLYQKSIIVTSNITSENVIAHNISDLENVINAFGTIKMAWGSEPLINPAQTQNSFYGQWANSIKDIDNTNFYIEIGSSRLSQGIQAIQVTLQYTKTTDTPGSGTWTPDGNLSHHYSTTEHIVGTWIDGSTLWEKVITGFSVTLQSGVLKDTGVNVSYISNVISVSALGDDGVSVIPVAGYKINNTLQMLGYQSGNVINKCIIHYTKSS